jgi:hypothetical protein
VNPSAQAAIYCRISTGAYRKRLYELLDQGDP